MDRPPASAKPVPSNHPPGADPVTRTFVVLAGGETGARLLTFATTVILTRRLGPTAFGLLSVATAVRLYLVCMVDGGIDSIGMREAAIQPSFAHRVAPALLVVRTTVAIVLALLVAIAGIAILPQPDGALLAACTLTLFPLALNVRWLLLGLGRTLPPALARLTGEALVFITVFVVLHDPGDVGLVPAAQVLGEGVAALLLAGVAARSLGPLPVRAAWKIARPILHESRPLVFHALLGLIIFNADVILLRAFRAPADAGYYAAAYLVIGFLINLGTVFYQSLLLGITRGEQRATGGHDRYAHALGQVLLAGIPVAVGGVLLAAPLMQAIFGSAYHAASLPFAILMVSVPASWLRNVAQAGQVANRRSDALLKTSLVAAGTNLGLNLWFIPRYGPVGAASVTLVTEVLRTSIALGWSRSIGLPGLTRRLWVRPLVGAGLMAAGLLALPTFPVWATVPAGIGLYALVVLPAGGLRRLRGSAES